MEFPTNGLMPKTESGVLDFLAQNPTYDGRGVTVAIFDTGCDPGAPGLLQTSDGKPKFVDFIDSTGSGDVDVSYHVTPDGNYTVTGLSGRTLRLNKDWVNPSGQFRLGIKSASDLFPKSVLAEITQQRQSVTQCHIDRTIAQLHARIESLKQETSPTTDKAQGEAPQSPLDKLKISTQDKKSATSELTHTITLLEQLGKKAAENVPLFDCVVWHDGERYRAVLDTHEDGDLTASHVQVLGAYSETFEFGTYSQEHLLNYTVKFYNDGNILSIVVAAGSHGTHVAGIVGAYYGENHPSNGQAPGCQMVSIKIGDTALGTMETSPGILRAVTATIESGCDIVNMSYGESIALPNTGRISEKINEMVSKHGVVFVSSAGNAGPNLTTAGAPGATTEHAISVGAVITDQMVSPQYSRFSELTNPSASVAHEQSDQQQKEHAGDVAATDAIRGKNYQWSSRGPSADGSMISLSACGGAYSSVPNWTKNAQQQMNGTSMSSPAACGIITLLLSAFKQKYLATGLPEWKYTPHRIRHIVEQSAVPLDDNDLYAQGNGLIHIIRAWDYANTIVKDKVYDLHHAVSVISSHNGNLTTYPRMRGVYLRAPNAHKVSHQFDVVVNPHFNRWQFEADHLNTVSIEKGVLNVDGVNPLVAPVSPTANNTASDSQLLLGKVAPDEASGYVCSAPAKGPLPFLKQFNTYDKLNLNRYLRLVCDAEWVNIPSSIVYSNKANSFALAVHPGKLPQDTSGVYHTVIKACIASNDQTYIDGSSVNADNILFTVPITVIVPEPDQSCEGQQNEVVDASSPAEIIPAFTHFTHDITLSMLQPKALFYQVPKDATWCSVSVATSSTAAERVVWIHSMQVVPHISTDDYHDGSLYRLRKDTPLILTRPVVGGEIIEFKFIQPWLVLGTTDVRVTVDFHGITVNNNASRYNLTLNDLAHTLTFRSLRLVPNFKPEIEFKKGQTSIRPSKTYLSQHMPCIQRDTFHDGKSVGSLVLAYSFEPKTAPADTLDVVLSCSPFDKHLYDSPVDAQLIRVFEYSKELAQYKHIHTSDAFSHRSKPFKMSKTGSYTILLHIKHHDHTKLAALTNTPLTITYSLPKSITVPITANVHSPSPRSLPVLNNIGSVSGYVSLLPSLDQIQKAQVQQGDVLLGSIRLLRASAEKPDSSLALFSGEGFSIPCTLSTPHHASGTQEHHKQLMPLLRDVQPKQAKPPSAPASTKPTREQSQGKTEGDRQIARLTAELKHYADSTTEEWAVDDYARVKRDILPSFTTPFVPETAATRHDIDIYNTTAFNHAIQILLTVPVHVTSLDSDSIETALRHCDFIRDEVAQLLTLFNLKKIQHCFQAIAAPKPADNKAIPSSLVHLLTDLSKSPSGSGVAADADTDGDAVDTTTCDNEETAANTATSGPTEVNDNGEDEDDEDVWYSKGVRVNKKDICDQRMLITKLYGIMAKYTTLAYMIALVQHLQSHSEGSSSTADTLASIQHRRQAFLKSLRRIQQWGPSARCPVTSSWLPLYLLFISIHDGLPASASVALNNIIPTVDTAYNAKRHTPFFVLLFHFTSLLVRSLEPSPETLDDLSRIQVAHEDSLHTIATKISRILALFPSLSRPLRQLTGLVSASSVLSNMQRPVKDILPAFF